MNRKRIALAAIAIILVVGVVYAWIRLTAGETPGPSELPEAFTTTNSDHLWRYVGPGEQRILSKQAVDKIYDRVIRGELGGLSLISQKTFSTEQRGPTKLITLEVTYRAGDGTTFTTPLNLECVESRCYAEMINSLSLLHTSYLMWKRDMDFREASSESRALLRRFLDEHGVREVWNNGKVLPIERSGYGAE